MNAVIAAVVTYLCNGYNRNRDNNRSGGYNRQNGGASKPKEGRQSLMLLPKRVKYRKQMRGRMTGKASRGTQVNYGEYGLQALEPAWISSPSDRGRPVSP